MTEEKQKEIPSLESIVGEMGKIAALSNIYNQYVREKIFNKKNLSQWEIGEILIFNDFHKKDIYEEEYNDLDGKLKFNIYNSHNTIVASNSTMLPTSAQPLVSYGDNRIKLNIASCTFTPTGNLGSGFYILEVINEKNEKWYLRFKHVLSISGLCAMEATYWER